MTDKSIKGANNSASLYVKDSDYTDGDVFKAAMTGHKIVYELATPITYQLTPQQIHSLLGRNNIWSDAGRITVKYHS